VRRGGCTRLLARLAGYTLAVALAGQLATEAQQVAAGVGLVALWHRLTRPPGGRQ